MDAEQVRALVTRAVADGKLSPVDAWDLAWALRGGEVSFDRLADLLGDRPGMVPRPGERSRSGTFPQVWHRGGGRKGREVGRPQRHGAAAGGEEVAK
jgi:hypothetical protein